MAIFKRNTAKTADAVEEPKVVAKSGKTAKVKKEDVVRAPSVPVSALAAKTLLAPLVTEKLAHLADSGVYAFRVPLLANRVTIREAFKSVYKVSPTSVRIMRVHGKEKVRGRISARLSDWKKALVTVPKGTRVDIFTL
ncbi:MAG: 50S ribosomal protein L23 [Patescibacteria group bacterium]|jgi:large subunit ribosomal protein L23